jgi:hypothetical protein
VDLHAHRRFYELHIGWLADFLSELAGSWRGWEGERKWTSLEGDIELTATHDGRGLVALVPASRANRERAVQSPLASIRHFHVGASGDVQTGPHRT